MMPTTDDVRRRAMKAIVTALPGSSPASAWTRELAGLLERAPRGEDLASSSDHDLIDLIAALERGKGALGACQAHAEVMFRESQIAAQRHQGVARGELGKGVADQVALARRITPKHASDQLVVHRILVETLPRTTKLLEQGEISEWAAAEVAKNVLVLSDEDRALVDQELEGRLPAMTASASGRATRARAQELDPAAAVKRASRAVAERRVSIRPAPDGMSILHAILPTKDGVACFKALTRESKSAKSSGDARGKGQIMADTLVERVTGATSVDAIPVEVTLLMTDTTLLGAENKSAWMEGFPIPGRAARDIALGVASAPAEEPFRASDRPGAPGAPVTEHSSQTPSDESPEDVSPQHQAILEAAAEPPKGPQSPPFSEPHVDFASSPPERDSASSPPERRVLEDAKRWIRRLYTDPRTGELTAADPRRRLFRGAVRRFILLRDQRCRTPWCDAAIHDLDHSTRYSEGGGTTIDNGIGYCQRFNLVREIPGWETSIEPAEEGKPARLIIVTPAGHRYSSTAPALVDPELVATGLGTNGPAANGRGPDGVGADGTTAHDPSEDDTAAVCSAADASAEDGAVRSAGTTGDDGTVEDISGGDATGNESAGKKPVRDEITGNRIMGDGTPGDAAARAS